MDGILLKNFKLSKKIPFSLTPKIVNLTNKKWITDNTFIGEINLKNNSNSLLENYIPPGLHFSLLSDIKIGNKLLSRRYTPIKYISENKAQILIKIYKDENKITVGKAGSFIENKLEYEIEYSFGKIIYLGNGEFLIKDVEGNDKINSIDNWKPVRSNKINFICAGTGITPILRILNTAYEIDSDIEFNLIFINSTVDDLYLKEEIENLKNKINLKTLYIVDREESIYTKRLDVSIVNSFIPKDSITFNCGSKIMMNGFLKPLLKEYEHYNF